MAEALAIWASDSDHNSASSQASPEKEENWINDHHRIWHSSEEGSVAGSGDAKSQLSNEVRQHGMSSQPNSRAPPRHLGVMQGNWRSQQSPQAQGRGGPTFAGTMQGNQMYSGPLVGEMRTPHQPFGSAGPTQREPRVNMPQGKASGPVPSSMSSFTSQGGYPGKAWPPGPKAPSSSAADVVPGATALRGADANANANASLSDPGDPVDLANQYIFVLQSSTNINERINAASALGRTSSFTTLPAVVRVLICDSLGRALCDKHFKVRAASACALGNLGESAAGKIRNLALLLDDAHADARAGAAFALGKLAGDHPNAARHAFALSVLLQDKYANVRTAAATAIGGIGVADARLAQAVSAILQDHDANVRAAAAYSLGKLGDEVKAHTTALASMVRDENLKVRESVLHALGKCGDACKPHIAILVDGLNDDQYTIRAAAANALGNLGEVAKPVVAMLVPTLKDDNGDVRAAAAFALGKLNEAAKPYTADLQLLMNDQRAKVRKAAACALARLCPQSGTQDSAQILSL